MTPVPRANVLVEVGQRLVDNVQTPAVPDLRGPNGARPTCCSKGAPDRVRGPRTSAQRLRRSSHLWYHSRPLGETRRAGMDRSTAVAARTTSRRGVAADPEAAEVDASTSADPFDDEPEEGVLEDDGEDPSDESLDDEEGDEGDLVDGDLASDEELSDTSDEDEGDEETVATALVTPDAAFDDDDDQLVAVVGGDDDEDDDEEIEGLRDGEFVCRSCHLAMRDTQLADARNMICRDCV